MEKEIVENLLSLPVVGGPSSWFLGPWMVSLLCDPGLVREIRHHRMRDQN